MFEGNIKDDQCFSSVPLEFLELNIEWIPFSNYPLEPPYEHLDNLTGIFLHLFFEDWRRILNGLTSFNAALQNLSISFHDDVRLNSKTLLPCSKWNQSLELLELFICNAISDSCCILLIYGSPFRWFPNLQILRIAGNQYLETILPFLSEDAFESLPNLEELHLNHLNTDIFMHGVFFVFGSSKFLKVMNLAYNEIEFDIDNCRKQGFCKYKLCEQIYPITSLEILDLSHNNFDQFFEAQCLPKNLKELIIRNQDSSRHFSGWSLEEFCPAAPSLERLDARKLHSSLLHSYRLVSCRFSNLKTFDLSENVLEWNRFNDTLPEINLPSLGKLHLQNTGLDTISNMHEIFIAPILKHLDVSVNQISVIDKKRSLVFK